MQNLWAQVWSVVQSGEERGYSSQQMRQRVGGDSVSLGGGDGSMVILTSARVF